MPAAFFKAERRSFGSYGQNQYQGNEAGCFSFFSSYAHVTSGPFVLV
ncbi:hypothetical protein ES703_92919 [subsurface metagenome]